MAVVVKPPTYKATMEDILMLCKILSPTDPVTIQRDQILFMGKTYGRVDTGLSESVALAYKEICQEATTKIQQMETQIKDLKAAIK